MSSFNSIKEQKYAASSTASQPPGREEGSSESSVNAEALSRLLSPTSPTALSTLTTKIHERKINDKFIPDEMETKLRIDDVQHIASFLSYKDQGQFTRTACFTRDAARLTHEYYMSVIARLTTEINALPKAPLAHQTYQRLLTELITFPIDPKHWASAMDALINHLIIPIDPISTLIQSHAHIADLLATAAQPISADQIYQFCKYLGQKQLSKRQIKTWIGYRVLEQYLLKLPQHSASINKTLKEYLIQEAKMHIHANDYTIWIPDNLRLAAKHIDIDPRTWFGFDIANSSLWIQPGVEHVTIPKILLEVLWTHIQSLRNSHSDQPFEVCMRSRAEAQIPRNFTIELAKSITNANIFLNHNNTVDDTLINSEYARSISQSLQIQKQLAEQYPNAVTQQNQIFNS